MTPLSRSPVSQAVRRAMLVWQEARGEIPEEVAQLMAAVSGPRCEPAAGSVGRVAAAGASGCLILLPESSPGTAVRAAGLWVGEPQVLQGVCWTGVPPAL